MTDTPPKLYGEARSSKKKTTTETTSFPFVPWIKKWLKDPLMAFFKTDKSTPLAEKSHPRKKNNPPKKVKRKVSLGRYLMRTFLTLGAWAMGFVLLAFLWFSYDLPDINQLQTSSRKASVVVQAIDGTVIGTYGDLYEDVVKVSELPPYVPQALMSIEDRRFYSHFGVDLIGLIRAAYTNYKANRIVQGGSTITQQLAKNFLQTERKYDIKDRSLRRKVQEVIIAIWLEWRFTKEQIMTMYLNRVYFGSATFGIEAASRKYFNKSAKNLTVYEAAVIAGLLKAPSRYSPTGNPQKSRQRATVVLMQMEEAGYIKSAKEYLQQHDEHVATETVDDRGAKFFADWVFDQLPSLIGSYDQDLIVSTTFDPNIQAHADVATRQMMADEGEKYKTTQMALIAMSPDGAVRAMIGGMNHGKSQFNRVTQAARQPGSTFKLFTYLAGLEAGLKPETYFSDGPITIGNWSPGNFRKYTSQGEVTMRYAFMKSVNTVTARIAAHVGSRRIVKVARRLGITSDILADWSVCLGAMEVTLLELTGSFATFANNGNSVTPYGILEIKNRKGEVYYQYQPPEDIQVIKPKYLYQMTKMMEDVVNYGTGRRAKLPCPVMGKSGSNGNKDAYFIGMTRNLVAGIWTGNDNGDDMHEDSTGGRLPAQTFARFMKPIVENKAPEEFISKEMEEEMQLEEGQSTDQNIIIEETSGSDIVEESTESADQMLAEIVGEAPHESSSNSSEKSTDNSADEFYKDYPRDSSPIETDFYGQELHSSPNVTSSYPAGNNENAALDNEFEQLIDQASNE